MEEKKNNTKGVIIGLIIGILLCAIGICVYLVVNKSNEVKSEEKTETKQEKKTTENTKNKNDEIPEANEQSNKINVDEIKETLKSVTTSRYNKISYIEIIKIVNHKIYDKNENIVFDRYEYNFEYDCSDDNFGCVQFLQIDDNIQNKNENGHYIASAYTFSNNGYYKVSTDGVFTIDPNAVGKDEKIVLFQK